MNTLAIDTSTPRGSVAFAGQEVVFERPVGRAALSPPQIEAATSSARWGQRVLPDLFSALQELNPTGFDEILVGVGPGSFTGIRAGLAAAKGLALPRQVPVKAAVSFDAIALAALPQLPRDCPQICVLSDARRDEVYFAFYDRAGRRTQDCRIAALEEIQLHNPVWFVSFEIEKYREAIRDTFGGFASVCETSVFPRASALQSSLLPLEPIYLRQPDYKKV